MDATRGGFMDHKSTTALVSPSSIPPHPTTLMLPGTTPPPHPGRTRTRIPRPLDPVRVLRRPSNHPQNRVPHLLLPEPPRRERHRARRKPLDAPRHHTHMRAVYHHRATHPVPMPFPISTAPPHSSYGPWDGPNDLLRESFLDLQAAGVAVHDSRHRGPPLLVQIYVPVDIEPQHAPDNTREG